MTTKKTTIANPGIVEGQDRVFQDRFRQNFGAWIETSEGLQHEERNRLGAKVVSTEILKINPGRVLPRIKETLSLTPSNRRLVDPDALEDWKKSIELEINTEFEFEDYITTFDLPLTLEESRFIQNKTRVIDSDFQFSHPFLEFEEIVAEEEVFETFIPNFYEVGLKAQNDEHFARAMHSRTALNLLEANLGRLPFNTSRAEREKDRAGYRNQIFPSDNLENLFNYNVYLGAFPMYLRMSFKTEDASLNMGNALHDSEIGTLYTRWLSQFLFDSEPVVQSIFQGDTATIENRRLRTVDFVDWRDDLAASILPELPDSFSFIDTGASESVIIAKTENPLGSAIALRKIREKMNEAILNFQRSYSDILNGKKAQSETILYRIAKFKGAPIGTPMQNFYIPNIDELEVLNFIDTQVKYNKEYSYIIYAEKMVVGSKYQYTSINFPTGRNRAIAVGELEVEIFPIVKTFEVPLITINGRILVTPPVYPELNIIPFKGIKDKLLLHFATNTNRFTQEPIVLQDTDKEFFDNIQTALGQPVGSPLEFETFLEAAEFQIFRTTRPPQSYGDFKDALFASVFTDVDSKTNLKASSAAYKMKMTPNTKYYLTFRTIDRNGGISNPSPIYQVEIYHESGVSYPIIQEYQFIDGNKAKLPSKMMNRLVQMTPRITQIFLNEKESGLKENGLLVESAKNKSLKLGLQEDALLQKTFKIRITSRLTGKKIDVNIDFKHKHNVTEFEREV